MYNCTTVIFDLPSEEGNTSTWLKNPSVMLSQCYRTYKLNHFFHIIAIIQKMQVDLRSLGGTTFSSSNERHSYNHQSDIGIWKAVVKQQRGPENIKRSLDDGM